MNRSLLNKSQRIYALYFTAIFIVVAPLFYFLTQQLYLESTDEYLLLEKALFEKENLPELKVSDIPVWNKFNANIKIQDIDKNRSYGIKGLNYFNPVEGEYELYRELSSKIQIEGKPYQLTIKVNMIEAEDLIVSIGLLFLSLLLILLIGFLFITRNLSRRLWSPFYSTLSQLRQFEINKASLFTAEKTDITEFLQLNDSIEQLIERNKIIYNNQREFIENAAHELQTPIAVLQSKIDILMQNENLTEDQINVYNDIYEHLSNYSRLNKNLLLLSKVDATKFIESESLNLNSIIEGQLDFFNEQAEHKGIQIEYKPTRNIDLKTNKAFLEVLTSNLLLNAIRHNMKNGKITIEVKHSSLVISNTGPNKSLQSEQIFKRFSKQGNAVTGNGLGLAIVKRICDLNGWNINYNFIKGLHSFTIEF